MLKLIIEDDEGKTTVVPLIRDEISIGRKEGNTIRLTERNVSRRHARLLRRNGNVLLEDLNSYNGIRVNGNRIQGQVGVAEGDRIQIGDYMLALKQDQPVAQAPTDPFDEMKTVPVEKAEAQAMAAHLAQQQGGAAAVAPAPVAAPQPAPAAPPAAAPEPQPAPPRQRDLIQEAAQAVTKAPPAKMVVVSANYAGLECLLDKAAQVIGRTDDNDIVIDHRSVSKHHAKIVMEGGSYSIVDQGSSNGVFVNGEKYDRIELRSGDIVDLGHVRMRFVAAGDPWIFDPATAVQTGQEGKKSSTALYGIVGGVVVVAVVVAVLFATGAVGGGKKKSEPSRSSTDEAMTAPMDSGRPMARPGDYQPIRNAIAIKDWKTAIKEADSLLLANSDDSEARALRQKSVEEQKNETHSTQFFTALQAGQWEKAVFEGSQVSSDSVYNADVSKRMVEVKKKYRQQLVAEANRVHRARDCAPLTELTRKMETLDPTDTTIRELGRSCRPKEDVVAVAPMDTPPGMDRPPPRDPYRPMDRPPPREVMRPVRVEPMDRPPPMDADTGPSADELLQQAQAASLSNQYGRAMMLAFQSIRKKPSSRAWAVYGAAACNSGNKNAAKRAFKVLGGGMRSMLVSLCKNKGIALP